jgi:O-antigen ligase
MMRDIAPDRQGAGFTAPLLVLALGVVLGILVSILAGLELRWITYGAGTLVLGLVFAMVRDREGLLWGLFILSLQLDVSVRFMHGHAGSGGIAFPLPALAATALVAYYMFSGRIYELAPVRWGGPLRWPIAALFLSMIAAALMSNEHFLGATAILTQAQLYLIYWIILNRVSTEQRFRSLIILLVASLVIQSTVYFVQTALGVTFTLTGDTREMLLTRHGGTVATGPHGVCNFILPPLLIAIAFVLATERWSRFVRGSFGIAAIMGVVALVLTLTRAAWAAFVLGVLWIAFFGYLRGIISTRRLAALALVITVAVVTAAPLIVARLEGAPLEKSYNERAALMRMAVEVIRMHPGFGVGPGAYASTYRQYISPELGGYWQSTVHNHYLLRAAEAGIPGAVAFVAVMLAGLAQAMRLARSPHPWFRAFGLAAGASIAGAAFDMYWDMWTFFTTQSMFWAILGTLGAVEALDKRPAESKPLATRNVRRSPRPTHA